MLQIILILILSYLCIELLEGFIDLFPNVIFVNFSKLIVSILITITGICLGAIIYKLSFSKKLPKKYGSKEYMTLTIEIISIVLLISMYLSYIFVEKDLEKAIIFVFTTIGIPIFFLIMPVISIFSILKKELKLFILSSLNLLSFYIFLIISKGLIDETKKFRFGNYHEIILFFILLLIFIEMGIKILDFDSIIKRTTQNRTYINDSVLNGFNSLLNKYVIFLAIFIILSYFTTLFVIQADFLSNIGENIGLKIGSIQNIILFTALAIFVPLFFWFHGTKEKNSSFKILKNIVKKYKKKEV